MLVSSLVACNNQHPETEQTIQVGDTIPGAYGETFEIYVWDENSRILTEDKAKVTVNVVLEKENDISNKDDYTSDSFYKYTYTINVSGVVDKKYAGKSGSTDTDNWMIGYNKNLLVGIWCGYDDNRLINSGDGI